MRLSHRGLALAATSIFLSLTFIDETGVAVTLPAMSEQLGLSQLGIQWVMNAFFLTLAVSVLGCGRIADIIGHRKAFLFGLLVFVLSSAAAALSPNGTTIVCTRVTEGIGAGFMLATYAVLLGRVFAPHEQGIALGTSASIASLFLACGPFIGGFLADVVSWRGIFWLNLPLGAITWAAIVKAIPEDIPNPTPEAFDLSGFLTFLIGFGSLILMLMQAVDWGWMSSRSIALTIVSSLGLITFVIIQLRREHPLAELRLFRKRTFLAANVILLTAQVSVMALAFWAVWLQVSLGYDPLTAGLLLLPAGLPILVMGRVGGSWADGAGSHAPIRVGTLLCLASAVEMAIALPKNHYFLASIGMLLYGFGAPLVISPAIKTVLMSVPPARAGVAAGMLNTMRQLGAAICFGVVGAVISGIEHQALKQNVDLARLQASGHAQGIGDAVRLIAAANLEHDRDLAAQMLVIARTTYGHAIGMGMWAAAAFAAIGFAFAVLGLRSSESRTAATPTARQSTQG